MKLTLDGNSVIAETHDGDVVCIGTVDTLSNGRFYFWPCETTWPGCWDGTALRFIADQLWILNGGNYGQKEGE